MPLPNTIGSGRALLIAPPPLWTPAQLPGLLAWYDGATAFGGASPGAAVASWAPLAGSVVAPLANATGSKQPLVAPLGDGVIFDGQDDYLAATFTNNVPNTVFLVGRTISNTASRYLMDGTTQNTLVAFQSPTSVDIRLYSNGVGPTKTGAGLSPFALAGVYQAGANNFKLYFNNDAVVSTTIGVQSSGGLTVAARNDFANPANVHIQAVIICSGALSAADIQKTLAYLMVRYPQRTNNLVVAYEGDSRSLDSTTYPTTTTAWLPPTVTPHNVAGSGETMAQIATQAAATAAFYDGAKTNIMVLHAGLNDSRLNGSSASAIYASAVTAVQGVKALNAGQKVMLCTEIDCQDALANAAGWHSTVIPAFNTLVRANTAGADVICDLGADARLANALDTVYFNADAIHLSTYGYTVKAALVARAVRWLA